MTEQNMNTHIFTNRNGNTLLQEFKGVLENNPAIKCLDAVVGFLRASGYFSLRPFLDGINKARILIGIDVDKYIVETMNRGLLFIGAENEVKADTFQKIRNDIETCKYSEKIEKGIFQLVQDLQSGKLELRAHPSKKIHAKIYLLYPENFNKYTQGMMITGSSNLSGNGLGISDEKQYEFNVKMTEYDDVQYAKDEFEALWKEAESCKITAEDTEKCIESTYLGKDATPYEIYIKMLMEYFSDRVMDDDDNNPLELPKGYTKYDYQIDAVIEGYQKLLRYDGFFLADVVGLGKTIIATMIAKKFLVENGRDNTKILVVYPPALESNWKTTFHDFEIDKYARFISNGSLHKILDEENLDYWNAEEYDLILVDEAHKFRSSTTEGFEHLQSICKMPRITRGNVGGNKKKVILISATPMNNSPEDLLNQILLFQDAHFCSIDGVPGLSAFFNPLIREFKSLKKDPEFSTTKFLQLSDKVRTRVIKPLTVRRTRTDIESIGRYSKDLNGFPKVEPPEVCRYELNQRLSHLFNGAMDILNNRLNYSRYQAIAYLKPEVSAGIYDNAELVSSSLSCIRKHGLVKRLESSFEAFKMSINRFRVANQNMIDMLSKNKVFIAPDLDINLLIEKGLSEEEIVEKVDKKAEENEKNKYFCASDFREGYLEQLKADQVILNKLCKDWEAVGDEDDSKFAKFSELLKHKIFDKDRNPGQKLVVFSESAETVEYLKRRIGRKDLLAVSSENRNDLFKTIRENFDANYKSGSSQKNDYNILVTTDVMAEGVNLHRSNVIVNYDTPWNSTRLMQRIGRVNRIGSVSKHIYNYVFYPSTEGNKEIKLNQIALSKLQTFHATFGEDNKIYSTHEIIDVNLEKLFDQAIEEEKKDRNMELPYYEELRELYKTNRREYNRIANLSIRSRTGREERNVDGVTLSNETLVFLKTNIRKMFFLVSENAELLSVLDALKFFHAAPNEKNVERNAHHHDHVEKALNEFLRIRQEESTALETTGGAVSSATSQIGIVKNLLTAFKPFMDDDMTKKVEHLKVLVERGTISTIVKRLQRIQKKLNAKGKERITRDVALKEIKDLANKYDAYYVKDESSRKNESSAEIILSESFK